jgi:UDP-N-acetylglucosamine diphosphorylase/glucosamine-1-phosphate N-acetyltransferase
MNIILFDDPILRTNLLPLTFTRPISEIRIGILKISEKWSKRLQTNIFYLTESYLQEKYLDVDTDDDHLYINGALFPNESLIQAIMGLKSGEVLTNGSQYLAFKATGRYKNANLLMTVMEKMRHVEFEGKADMIHYPWEIFQKNRNQIIADYQLITAGRKSEKIADKYTKVYGKQHIFIEEGANIKASVLNAEEGVIYIGKNAVIQEGSLIRGAFALCEGATLNMGAKIKGDTTIGQYCKVGGEVSNSILFGYSNKGHEGFIGNTVIGEWCNLGADTNTSNLKNNYSSIKVWNYTQEKYIDSQLQFCGLLMGDHSKCSINTMFNTGTVMGVGANVFDYGFPPKFVPDFSWGGSQSFVEADFDKTCEIAERMMGRRHLSLSKEDKAILRKVFENTSYYRTYNR